MKRSRVLMVGVSCGLSACTLLTNLDGLSGDGSSEGNEGGGGVDATAGDGAQSTNPDGSSTDGAASGPFCKGLGAAPIFCADFDDGLEPNQIFFQTESSYGDAGVRRIDTTRSVSPPASLELSGPDVVSGASASNLVFALGSRPATKVLRVELDMRAEAMNASGNVLLIGFGFEAAGGQAVYLSRKGGSLVLDEELFGASDGGSHSLGRALPLGVWVHVKLVLDLTKRRVSAALDGTTLVDQPSAGSSTGGPAMLIIGYTYDPSDAGISATSLRYDNMVMFSE